MASYASDTAETAETTYPLRTAARLTGLQPELLRAWERRYGAVEPLRSPGGTRRYRASDLERLQLLKSAVDAGHRISEVANLDSDELKRRASAVEPQPTNNLGEILAALDALDAAEVHRLLSLRLSALGAMRFANEIALPLAREFGDRWLSNRLSIASEHLGSGVLRSLLGSALVPAGTATLLGPRVLFATLSGERHEIGLQTAALTAMGAGANPIYLGLELPVEEILAAVERSGAAALALSIVSPPDASEVQALRALCGGLPDDVFLWVGGAGAQGVSMPEGAEHIDGLEKLAQRVALLAANSGSRT